MSEMKSNKIKYFLELVFIIIIFLIVSYLVQSNLDFFESFFVNKPLALLGYILFVQLAIVFAPLSATPLIPLMTNLFGPFYTSLVNIFAWTLGSIIVFFISRKWGVLLVKKLIPLKELYKLENKMPKEDQFWTMVFLRMILPVDILSYALGIFSNVKFGPYVASTLLGKIPLIFLLSYFGYMSFIPQLISLLSFGILILIILIFRRMRK